MAVNVPGVIVMMVFYLLVLGTGIWAYFKSRRKQRKSGASAMEMTLVANRSINLLVGIFTMTATWVGGGIIAGSAEMVYTPSIGLVGTSSMLLAYALSFIIGGLVFAKPMREKLYMTLLDPFQVRYDRAVASAMGLVSMMVEMMWFPSTLSGLGGTMSVVLDLPFNVCIWISAAVAIVYTLLGGLYSVAYTDVIQLVLIFTGLWICVPFVLTNPDVQNIGQTLTNNSVHPPWIGELEMNNIWIMIDNFLFFALGGLACQCFHQRTLSASSLANAKITCFVAGLIYPAFGLPSILIGAAAASVDWNVTRYGSPSPYERGQAAMVLPIALEYLTPTLVSIVGTGCMAAAVMSSCDSLLLSVASIFSTNVYQVLRPQASDKEKQWVVRASVLLVGLLGTSLANLKNSIITFWFLGNEVAYVLIFPQLVCVLFCSFSNAYGVVSGLLVALVVRLLNGDDTLGLAPVFHYPGCTLQESGTYVQCAPVRTISMLSSLVSILIFSKLTNVLLERNLLPERWDVFRVKNPKSPSRKEPRTNTASQPMVNTSC